MSAARRWKSPPRRIDGPAFGLWADTMLRRGFTAWEIACRIGVSETRVTSAVNRYRAALELYGRGDGRGRRA